MVSKIKIKLSSINYRLEIRNYIKKFYFNLSKKEIKFMLFIYNVLLSISNPKEEKKLSL